MNATIHYGPNKNYQVGIAPAAETFVDTALAYLWDETQGGIAEIIGRENQLEQMNKGGARLRSSMVGDVFGLPDDKFYVVDGIGFKQVSKEQFERFIQVPERDRCMGWKWVQQRYDIGLHLQNIE